jgi:uncharacterized protein YbjT (DUF2867 family)
MPPALIFGASRGVGLELARLLRRRGTPVIAMLRRGSDDKLLRELDVTIVRGDAFNRDDLARAVSALPDTGAIVSTLGGRDQGNRYVDDEGNINVIDAAEAGRIARFVLVTSIGCGDMRPYMSERARAAFGEAVDAKTRAEEYLQRSRLSWTTIRPGGLRSEPATGRGILSLDPEMHGFIHRADVADLIGRVLRDPRTAGFAYAAVDTDLARSANPLSPVVLAE